MTDIVWGPEIVVNGVRPEWLEDGDKLQWRGRKEGWMTTTAFDLNFAKGKSYEISEIRLPIDHPHYADNEPTEGPYDALTLVLMDAYNQAAHGKGQERHAQGLPFAEQPMQRMTDLYGQGFPLGQAAKKAQESMRLPYDRARAELLGAIVYIAGAIVALDRGQEQ